MTDIDRDRIRHKVELLGWLLAIAMMWAMPFLGEPTIDAESDPDPVPPTAAVDLVGPVDDGLITH